MVQAYVIDTTVFVQAYMEDTDTARVRTLFTHILDPDPTLLHTPEFCLIECANILWKRVRFSGLPIEDARRAVGYLVAAPVMVHRASDYLARALDIGLTYQLAVYDATVIALAEALGYPLITADVQQTRVAQAVGITLKPITDFPPYQEQPNA